MKYKKQITQISVFLGIVLSLSLILGAVSDPYLSPETPLKLAPGETFIATLNLQNANPSESGDKVFVAEITGESIGVEVIENDDLRYTVPYGEISIPVKIKINVPETMKSGDIGKVIYSFKEEKVLDTGMVTMLPATGNAFKVYVVDAEESALSSLEEETPKTIPTNLFVVIILVLVILTASIYLIKKHNEKTKKQKK